MKELIRTYTLAVVVTAALFTFVVLGWQVFRSFTVAPGLRVNFDYDGDWRGFTSDVLVERPLPTANLVLQDFSIWDLGKGTSRVYSARLGGVGLQSNFWSDVKAYDIPLGASWITRASFDYHSLTGGVYRMSWQREGKLDGRFLKFDGTNRLYLLRPVDQSSTGIPELRIEAIEGLKPPDRS
ncbi:MAG: hypothetical protein ACPGVU_00250 [Limisphaerales bacterium]